MALLLMSFAVGLLTGLTSMGGAALMTPFLLLVVGVRPILAVGTDLVYGAVTRMVGAWMHFRHGTIDMRTVRHLACGSIPGGFAGFFLLQLLQHNGVNPDQYLRRAIGVVLVVMSAILLLRSLYPLPQHTPVISPKRLKFLTIGWGALAGLAVGITSVGSGSLIAPFLLALYPKDPVRIVGTDVFHSALLVTTTAMLYTNAGKVEWQLVPILLAGSIPGVLVGSYFATRVPIKGLRVSLSLVLLATGIKLF
jgi:uncharacterized protein